MFGGHKRKKRQHFYVSKNGKNVCAHEYHFSASKIVCLLLAFFIRPPLKFFKGREVSRNERLEGPST